MANLFRLFAFFLCLCVGACSHAQNKGLAPVTLRTPLTETELAYARTAWRYFAVNEDPATGLMKSVNNYNSMTLWDEGYEIHTFPAMLHPCCMALSRCSPLSMTIGPGLP